MSNTNWHSEAVIDGTPPTLVAIATDEEPWQNPKVFMSDEDQARVRSGEVIATIRLRPKQVLAGPLTFDSGLTKTEVEVFAVRQCTLSTLTTEDLNCAGFDSMYDFRRLWAPYCPDMGFARPVTVIYFRRPM
jgi:hypothetical protein